MPTWGLFLATRALAERTGFSQTVVSRAVRRIADGAAVVAVGMATAGVWARVLEKTQCLARESGDLDWVASIDSTIVRVHQHGATLPRTTGGSVELQKVR